MCTETLDVVVIVAPHDDCLLWESIVLACLTQSLDLNRDGWIFHQISCIGGDVCKGIKIIFHGGAILWQLGRSEVHQLSLTAVLVADFAPLIIAIVSLFRVPIEDTIYSAL